MKVTLVGYEDLPDGERRQVPNNGIGRCSANYLKVELDDNSVFYFSDAMEIEDALFCRDLAWIKPLVELAYIAGMNYVLAQRRTYNGCNTYARREPSHV